LKKFLLLFIILVINTSFTGVLNYTRLFGGNGLVLITQINASDRARYTASDLMTGQNLDFSDIRKINGSSIDRNTLLKNLGTLGQISLTNASSSNISIKFIIEVATSIEGPLIRFKTDPSVFNVVVPANGTRVLDSVEVYNLNDSWINPNSTTSLADQSKYDALQNAAIFQYAQTGELVPPRTYIIKVNVVNASNETLYDSVQASVYQPGVSGKTELSLPATGEQIPFSNSNPTFIWRNEIRTGVNLTYTFSLYDFKDSDSLVGVISGIPKYSTKIINSKFYTYDGPSLELGKKYAWKIETYDGTDRFLSTAFDWFQYEVPQPVRLNAPLDEVTHFPVLFSWMGVMGADRYQLSISIHKDFSDPKVYDTDGMAYSVNYDSFFEPEKAYYWKVEPINKMGLRFVPDPQVGRFIFHKQINLVRPQETQVKVLPPQFQWSDLEGAQAYRLRIADNLAFSHFKEFIIDQTSFQPEASDDYVFDKTYYWKVQALSSAGSEWGPESSIGSFKSPERESPFLISPMGEELPNIAQVQFNWQNTGWAKSYDIQVADNRDMKNAITFKSTSSPLLVQNTDGWMQWAKTYYWQVLPYDDNKDNFGKKSEMSLFKTMPRKAPVLIAPLGDEIEDLSMIGFNWDKPLWASKYQLLIADNPEMDHPLIINAFPPFGWKNDGLVRLGKTYYWQVIPVDDQGQSYGVKSDIMTFRSKPISNIDMTSPLGDIYDSVKDILINWTPIEGAAQYQVLLSQDDPSFQNATIFYSEKPPFTIQANKLKSGTKYIVRINAIDKDSQIYGSRSNDGSFFINNEDNSVPKPAVIVYPVGNIHDANPIIKWTDLISADSYEVILNTASDGSTSKMNVKTTEVELSKLGAVPPGETCRVSVQALDEAGKAFLGRSKETSFTLPLPSIKLLNPIGKPLSSKDIKLLWQGDKQYSEYKVIVWNDSHKDESKTYSTKEQQMDIKGLELGAYSWQVTGVWKGVDLFKTTPASFTIVPSQWQGNILLTDPNNKYMRGDKVLFSWTPIEGLDEYKIRLGKGIDDVKEYKTKDKMFELVGLESGNYNWQVVGIKEGRDVLMSSIAVFKFDNEKVISSSQITTDNIKPSFIEATPQDVSRFADFVKEYLKANGAANLMEGMEFQNLLLDGRKENINTVLLQELIDDPAEIKYLKVR